MANIYKSFADLPDGISLGESYGDPWPRRMRNGGVTAASVPTFADGVFTAGATAEMGSYLGFPIVNKVPFVVSEGLRWGVEVCVSDLRWVSAQGSDHVLMKDNALSAMGAGGLTTMVTSQLTSSVTKGYDGVSWLLLAVTAASVDINTAPEAWADAKNKNQLTEFLFPGIKGLYAWAPGAFGGYDSLADQVEAVLEADNARASAAVVEAAAVMSRDEEFFRIAAVAPSGGVPGEDAMFGTVAVHWAADKFEQAEDAATYGTHASAAALLSSHEWGDGFAMDDGASGICGVWTELSLSSRSRTWEYEYPPGWDAKESDPQSGEMSEAGAHARVTIAVPEWNVTHDKARSLFPQIPQDIPLDFEVYLVVREVSSSGVEVHVPRDKSWTRENVWNCEDGKDDVTYTESGGVTPSEIDVGGILAGLNTSAFETVLGGIAEMPQSWEPVPRMSADGPFKLTAADMDEGHSRAYYVKMNVEHRSLTPHAPPSPQLGLMIKVGEVTLDGPALVRNRVVPGPLESLTRTIGAHAYESKSIRVTQDLVVPDTCATLDDGRPSIDENGSDTWEYIDHGYGLVTQLVIVAKVPRQFKCAPYSEWNKPS